MAAAAAAMNARPMMKSALNRLVTSPRSVSALSLIGRKNDVK